MANKPITALASLFLLLTAALGADVVSVGDQLQLFLDDALIDTRLHVFALRFAP